MGGADGWSPGLVGRRAGGLNSYGTVEGSHATGAVSATGASLGGLVGYNDTAGTVEASYATGAVSTSAATFYSRRG